MRLPDHSGWPEGVDQLVRSLEGLKIDDLRRAWRRMLDSNPPPLRSGDMLRRCLAEQIQFRAYGRDLELEQRLARLAKNHSEGRASKIPAPTFKTGTILVREFAGQTHRVEVLEQGFSWMGVIYKSLSRIAREITGTPWNGPKFFGLRDGGAR